MTFGFGRLGPRHGHGAAVLAHLPAGAEAVIRANPDRKSRDMGLFPGTPVRMLRNHAREKSLVVAAGDVRLLVSRAIAARVHVQ